MSVNLKKAAENSSDGDFTSLPAGRYLLKVEDAEVKAATTGNTMISVTFVVAGKEFTNRKLWHNFTLTDKALPFLARFLKALGSDIIEEEDVEEEAIAQDMIGKMVTAYTEPGKTVNGNPKNDLKNWMPVEDATDVTGNANDELFS